MLIEYACVDNSNDAYNWVACTAIMERLINEFQDCKSLLTKVKTEISPNPISFLVNTIDIILSIQEKSEKYITMAKQTLNTLLTSSHKTTNESNIYNFVEHDPGKRKSIESSAQRKHLIILGPHQPKLALYPINFEISIKKQNRFTSLWYKEYPHLEYSILNDAVYCFICSLFPRGLNRQYADPAWVKSGVRSWHKMKSRGVKKCGKLVQHFSSTSHKSALVDFSNFLNSSQHIDCLFNIPNRLNFINVEYQKSFHEDVIAMLLDVTRTLARQGLAFRGEANDENSNFYQIVLLLSRHSSVMKEWIDEKLNRKHKVTYLSHESQNEFIGLLAEKVKKNIIDEVIEAGMYSVMADTTPDVSHSDQLSVCVRYVSTSGEVFERLLDIHKANNKTGQGIAEQIHNVLKQNVLPVENIAFQSYDYASSMSGKINGTQQKLLEIVGHQIPFIPCQAHRLNTFLKNSCEASVIIGDLFFCLVFFFRRVLKDMLTFRQSYPELIIHYNFVIYQKRGGLLGLSL